MNGLRFISILTILVVLVTFCLPAKGLEDFSFQLKPALEVPMGPNSTLFSEEGLYKMGGGADLKFQYVSPKNPLFYLEGVFHYGLHSTPAIPLSLISGGLGGGVNLRLGNVASLFTGAEVGGYAGFFPGSSENAYNPYAGGSANVFIDFSPNFSLSFGTGYRYYLGYDDTNQKFTDLYQGLNVTIGTVLRLSRGTVRSKLIVDNVGFDPVFPVFYGYYDDHPVGTISLINGENSTITDVKVYFHVNQYMEQPKLCADIPSVKRGEAFTVDLKALFTNSVMQLTEATKVSSEITTEYTYLGKRFTYTAPQTLKIYDRNSMVWDDDRKAASFVTAKDPTTLLFSKNTAGLIREQGNNPINLNLRIALGMFETLRLYGTNYVIDPQSAYVEASKNSQFIDFLQFPSQTLTFRAGDCDDLSILFSSLLESVGIETAFITIPGHIFMGFSLDMSEKDARKEFASEDDFIFIDGKTWVPVEVTMLSDGFLKAWKIAAKQWREYSGEGKASFYPIHEAWELYDPVAMPGAALSLVFPARESILDSYTKNIETFINREIQGRVDYYENRLSSDDSPKMRNRFGVLYARYGLYKEAEAQFARAASLDSSYIAPLINLGNISFLRQDMDKALSWYLKAEKLDPSNSKILAGLARTQYEREEYESVREKYNDLKISDPEMASKYAYLVNETTAIGRAAIAGEKGKTQWEEEE